MVGGFGPRAYGFLLAHIKHEAFHMGFAHVKTRWFAAGFFVAHMKTQAELEIFGALAI